MNEVATGQSTRCADSGPDADALAARAEIVSHLLQAHGGGIELVPHQSADTVRVRFTGLCTNCCLRPLTMANIVIPVLTDLEGVRTVEAEGGRISDEGMALLLRGPNPPEAG